MADPKAAFETITIQLGERPHDPLATLPSAAPVVELSAEGALGPAAIATQGLPLVSSGEQEEHDLAFVRQLGEGGMGRVDLAIQRALRREVAVKTTLGDSEEANHTLVQEAMFGGFLEHPNIVPIHLLGRNQSDQPVLVMKRVEGVAWRDLIAEPDHPHWEVLDKEPLLQHLEILMAVCNAVHYAHSNGVVHRDIKPENVMIGAFGEVYLLDWGVATRLDGPPSKAVVGTLAYMAPEMLDGTFSRQSDVYLLGASLHEALVGAPPHSGSGVWEVVTRIALREATDFPPEVPAELGELCNLATHRDPSRRPQSALELRQRVEQFLEHRASYTLCEEAEGRLGELRDASAESSEVTAGAFAACQFGFEQALRVWPENEDARVGLQTCLELRIDRELRRRNRGLVESLLAALPRPVPALAERLAQLDAELAEQERSRRELAALQQEHDPLVAGRQRGALGAVASALGCAAAWGAGEASRRSGVPITHGAVALAIALLTGVVALGVGALGRSLLATTFGRGVASCVLTGIAAILLNHGLCWQLGLPVETGFVFDALLAAAIVTVISATLDSRVVIMAAAALVAALTAAAWPARALEILGSAMLAGSLLMAWRELWDHRRSSGAEPG